MANKHRRLVKEIQDIVKDSHSGITVTSPDGKTDITDFTHFRGHFRGPADTPYEGGRYEIDIKITGEYPFKPPNMRFITKIWHPNVSSQTGAICLDTLGTAWSPVLTLKSALMSLQSLLSSPEPKDPQDAEVAQMLLTRPEEFKHVARTWAQKYAGAAVPKPGDVRSGASSSTPQGAPVSGDVARENKKREEARKKAAYEGYNKNMVDRFVQMGFQVEQVVSAFTYVGIEKNDGQEYEMEEEYQGDIVARLFGEEV